MFMELPISGLHRLFNTVPTSQWVREKASLESLTEETHTYDLLYPDYEALLHAQDNIYPLSQLDPASVAAAATSYDDRSDLDIQSSRDIRVVVAQDGNAIAQQPRVLYDSHPPASPRTPPGAGSNTGRGRPSATDAGLKVGETGNSSAKPGRVSHSTRNSVSVSGPQESPSPDNNQKSAFWGPHLRKSGLRSSIIDEETKQAKSAREGREETDALLGCMFGHTGLPLVSSTKLHINPPRAKISEDGGVSSGSPDSAGPRLFPKRRTPLTRSMTAEDFQSPANGSIDSVDPPHLTSPMKGPSILVTRLFSVELQEAVIAKATSEVEGVQSPHNSTIQPSDNKASQMKVPKIPKYGVAILIQMPPIKRQNQLPSTLTRRSRLGSSYEEPPYLAAVRENLGREDSTANGDCTMVDKDIERIVAHWSVLTRAVSCLEAVARSVILTKLEDVSRHDLALSSNAKSTIHSPTKTGARPKKYKQPSQRTIQLPSLALQDSVTVAKSARETSSRVVSALKIRRVVAGQGRWGVWREEARWVGRWAGGKEQNFFLFNLLTAFLGNHTEWLDLLPRGCTGSRRTETTQQEMNVVKHRTVIVSADKMATRRLIFLLSAFLPCSYVMPQTEPPARPLSSRSSTGLSRSPPAGIPIPRERSLRRTINRRPRGNRTASPVHLHERSISFTTQDAPAEEDNSAIAGPSMLRHSRRTSDTRSIRGLALPIPTSYAEMRKSSITTVSTLTPDGIAVPHFASPPTGAGGTTAVPRPGSSGSLASLSLRRTLSRSGSNVESMSPESPSASRWGSMISGFWSVRRGSSTDHSDPTGSPREGLGISGTQYSSSPGKLEMEEELDPNPGAKRRDQDRETLHGPPSPGTITEETSNAQGATTAARDIPERVKAEEYPMKLSIDTNDGVVDIDLPTAGSYPSSFDSGVSSPKMPNTASSSFNDHASTYGRASPHRHTSLPADSSPAVDVAGYLKTYHQDFALQAVRPYKGLKEEVKASMLAEATSNPASVEECTTLIADTTTFSIIRLTLRHQPPQPSISNPTTDSKPETSKANVVVTEEPLMDLDPTLIAAVERVIAHSQPSSVAHSRATSPSRAKHHDAARENRHAGHPGLEVSRSECRSLILGALEKVVRSVSAELHQQRGESEGGNGSSEKRKAASAEPDSTLREGVRRWLREGSHA